MIARIPSWLRVIIFLFGIWGIIEYYVDSGGQPAIIKYPEVGLILALVLFILDCTRIGVECHREDDVHFPDSRSTRALSGGQKTGFSLGFWFSFVQAPDQRSVDRGGRRNCVGPQLRWNSGAGQCSATLVGLYVLCHHNFRGGLSGSIPCCGGLHPDRGV